MALRLMFIGDSIVGSHSAYSKVGYELCTRTVKLGHQVAHTPIGRANNMGRQQTDEGVFIFESGSDPLAEDVAVDNYVDFGADMMIACKEPWVWRRLHRFGINWVPYAIIDHSPVSPMITRRLDIAFRTLAPSRFAQRELRRNNIESTYVPHGVDTQKFKPLDKKKCRELWRLEEDTFVVGIVAMNRARKMIPRQLRGYKKFILDNPDVKTKLQLWTNVYPSRYPESPTPLGVSDTGASLLPEIMRLDLGDYVRFPDEETMVKRRGIPDRVGEGYEEYDMVTLYNTMDCLLNCTGGEAFGLNLVEAESCGVPVVTTDFAGGPEQVGVGFTVGWGDYVIYSTPGIRRPLPSIDGMAEALTKILNADGEKMARKARRFGERYSWDRIISDYWKPFLDECSEELYPLLRKEGKTVWA